MNACTMEWRPWPRNPTYEVSEHGDMRRSLARAIHQSGRRLRGVIDADGYIRYSFRNEKGEKAGNVCAHVAVAETFIGLAPSPQHEVAHRNGSRLHNHYSNLRWATSKENHADRFLHGTASIGEGNPKAKITEEDVRYIRRRYREIKLARGSVAELDRQFGLCRAQVIRIARGKAWTHVA